MCGRFQFIGTEEQLAQWYDLAEPPPEPVVPRYNIAPGQRVVVVGLKADGVARGAVAMQWGFVPRWATEPLTGVKPINAKAETVSVKPYFRESFASRRCLVPATGFYEWQSVGGTKQPMLAQCDAPVWAMAGVWDR
ncbi:MAG: SOS response-associated peptidase, partial [Gemmataceae bacterium]